MSPILVPILALMIPIVAIVSRTIVTPWLTLQHRRLDLDTPTTQSADAMRAQEELRQLKERVAVLERVITDSHGSLDLDREIERLRDR